MLNYEVKENKQYNSIELYFNEKPGAKERDAMKAAKMKWNPKKCCWYGFIDVSEVENMLKGEKVAPAKKENKNISLWERCQTESIKEHEKHKATKEIAAETRKHLKELFPEIKISCRIGSGGWSAHNEVNVEIKEGPYKKDSEQLDAVKNYIKSWLWSYNYDNSDSMTDYFDRGFYESISLYDYKEIEPTEAQKKDISLFEKKAAEKKAAEEEKAKLDYEKYLKEQEENKKRYEEQRKKEEEQHAEIMHNVNVVDIEESEKSILYFDCIAGHGKESNLNEVEENGTADKQIAVIKRELYFTDENIYNIFCNMFLHDFSFLKDCGGYGTLDNRVTQENFYKLNSRQRNDVAWIMNNCISVYYNNELKLIIDPEGYSYARYVYIVKNVERKILLEEAEKEETEKKDFYMPEPIEKQAENLETEKNYTIISIDPWTLTANMKYITIKNYYISNYAQYEKALFIEYIEKGKRKTITQIYHHNNTLLLFKDFIEPIPKNLTYKKINDNMYEVLTAGSNSNDFMINVCKYLYEKGKTPVINTLQY